jgi:hypothetical protein
MENPMTATLLANYPATGRKETDEHHGVVRALIDQFVLLTKQIIFPTTAINPTAGLLAADAEVITADLNDIKMLFGANVARRVQVDVDGGSTAAGAEISTDGVNWGATAYPEFVDGSATVMARATGVGTVILVLTDVDGSGLTLGGNATITFS